MASKKRPRGDRKKHRQVHCNLCADAEKSLEHALPAVEIAQNSVIHRLHHLHRLAAAEAQVGLQGRRAQPAGRSTGIHRLKIDHVAVDAVASPPGLLACVGPLASRHQFWVMSYRDYFLVISFRGAKNEYI